MDGHMSKLQQSLTEDETNAEHILLARHQLVENDKVRNGNREALTALRKKARTTKTSVPSPFETIMKDIDAGPRSLVKEICPSCGDYNPKEGTWMMFPGSDVFACVPFHVAHIILEKVNDVNIQLKWIRDTFKLKTSRRRGCPLMFRKNRVLQGSFCLDLLSRLGEVLNGNPF